MVVLAQGIASVLALVLYGWDKAAARRGTWRARENTLHPRRAARRLAGLWFTVAANCTALAWWPHVGRP